MFEWFKKKEKLSFDEKIDKYGLQDLVEGCDIKLVEIMLDYLENNKEWKKDTYTLTSPKKYDLVFWTSKPNGVKSVKIYNDGKFGEFELNEQEKNMIFHITWNTYKKCDFKSGILYNQKQRKIDEIKKI